FRRTGRDCASDGPGAPSAPALMALAKFIAVSAPGQVPEVAAIFANDVNVCAVAADAFEHFPLGVRQTAMVLLHQNVVALIRIFRAAELRMHVAPCRSL